MRACTVCKKSATRTYEEDFSQTTCGALLFDTRDTCDSTLYSLQSN